MANTNISVNLTDNKKALTATNFAELQTIVNALNELYKTEGGKTVTVEYAAKRVTKACADFTADLKAARISELLDMGTGVKMWREFFTSRTYPVVNLYEPNEKHPEYRVNKPEDCKNPRRIQISDMNAEYVKRETARMEQAGEMATDDLTIARLTKFDMEYKLLISMVRRSFCDSNFGKKATGCGYVIVDKKGNTSAPQGKGYSINEIVKQFDVAVTALLPEDFTDVNGKPLHMYKADVKELGAATNNSRNGVHGMSGAGVLEDWFAILIQKRINNDKTIRVTVPAEPSETKTVSIPTTTVDKAAESTKEAAKTATVGKPAEPKTTRKTSKAAATKEEPQAAEAPKA